MDNEKKVKLIRIIVTVLISVIIFLIPENVFSMKDYLFFIPYIIIGYDVILEAIHNIKNKEPFDEHFLMVVATIGSICLFEMHEAIMVMLLYQVGEFFQDLAVDKSKEDIGELMDIRPDYANILLDNGDIKKINPEEVNLGDTIIIKPGEKVPIDGVIIEGETSFNTTALNGESLPRRVYVGDNVISGFINYDGLIKVKTTTTYQESTVSKIIKLLDSATEKKSKSENFINKFAKVYTPIVCLLAFLVAVIPPIFSFVFYKNANFSTWLYRALTFLVISCPCALVISIPLAFYSFIGYASNHGILVKGSSYLENLSHAKVFAYDKTGTMTKGVYEVVGIHHTELEEKRLLYISAHAESFSTHPVAESIIKKYGDKIDRSKVKDVKEIAGYGISCIVEDKNVLIGNDKLMERYNISYIKCSEVGTIVHVAIDNAYQGHILIKDVLRPHAKESISALKENNIKDVILLSGDRKEIVESIANEVGIDKYYYELLPYEKILKVEDIMNNLNKNEKLVFVGDGINDAPVIKRADIGMAMGRIGSDSAIEASDIVVMDDNPMTVVEAYKISKKCMKIVWQNIILAISVKIICLILSAIGISNMWIAIFADVGIMIIAVLNSMKILVIKKI